MGWRPVAAMRREPLVNGLVRIGEKEMTGEDEAEVDAYFASDLHPHGLQRTASRLR
jgi:hypothetical protein